MVQGIGSSDPQRSSGIGDPYQRGAAILIKACGNAMLFPDSQALIIRFDRWVPPIHAGFRSILFMIRHELLMIQSVRWFNAANSAGPSGHVR